MKFALLGFDPHAQLLLDALAAGDEHSLVFAHGVPDEFSGDLIRKNPGLQICESWADLLSCSFDRLIVAGHDAELLDGARQLAANNQAVALIPHAAQGSAFVYGLSLVHDDNRVPLVPVPSLATNPLVEDLCRAIEANRLGSINLLRLERQLPADSGTFTRAEIDAALLQDVCLLRKLAGGYGRVTAVHAGSPDAISQATVTLGGDSATETSWLCRSGDTSWILTVTGTSGEATLTLDPSSFASTDVSQSIGELKLALSEHEQPSSAIAFDSARAQLKMACKSASSTDWGEMIRSFECVEATHTSLRRRRTIDLYFETTSERSIFKSQMTAMGCGLLLLTLFGLVAFLLLGAFLDSRSILQRNAEADGRVVHEVEFEAGSAILNESGEDHIEELARKLERKSESVFVMPSRMEQPDLDDERLAAVTKSLVNRGHPEAVQLVSLAELPNAWIQWLLKILRVAWIAPLVLFLGLQTLLLITRPSAENRADSPESA